jgi:hypothetical protein
MKELTAEPQQPDLCGSSKNALLSGEAAGKLQVTWQFP